MELDGHPSSLKNHLICFLNCLRGGFLRLELDVPKSFAKATRVSHNTRVRDPAVVAELSLELLGGDFEEEVADVENVARRLFARLARLI